MTEKRFTIKSQDDYFGITDNNVEDKMNVINGIHTEIEAKWLCDLLNALHEENRELQRHLDVMRSGALTDDKRIKELYDENEQLKEQWKEKRHEDINELSVIAMRYKALEKENEQLKNNIKEAYQSERTMIGKSVLKQLMETIQ